MRARVYERYLTKAHIENARDRFGFDGARRVERHIMDFEVHCVISKNILGYARGGMAVPFHTPGTFARLSEDIDMYVLEGVDAARARMLGLEAELGVLGITMEEHRPAGGGLPIPLVTYILRYASVTGVTDEVKIDLLCDARLEYLPHREFGPPLEFGHFSTLHPVVALDAGALVADKITSLSIGTIGYPPGQRHKMNKQVYDIGQLLKHMSDDQIEQAIRQYDGLALRKAGYARKSGKAPAYGADDVADGVCRSLLHALGRGDRFVLEAEFKGNFAGFKGAYLGRRPYSKSAHRADTALTLLLAAVLLEHGQGGIATTSAVEVIRSAVGTLELMKTPSTRSAGKERIDGSPRPDRRLEEEIRNLPPELQYLLRQVSYVSPGLLGQGR